MKPRSTATPVPNELREPAPPYAYRCDDASLLCPAFRRLFCEPLLARIPANTSANLLTLIGSTAQLSVFAFVSWRATFDATDAPSSLHLLPAFGLFVYLLLDIADGMQARRTKTSSPVGELLDHWFDNFATFMIPLGLARVMRFGPEVCLVLVFAAGSASWATYWEQRATGVLRFAPVGEVEGNLMAIVVHVLTAGFGPGIWRAQLSGVRVAWVVLAVMVGGFALAALRPLVRTARCRREFLGVALTAAPFCIHAYVTRESTASHVVWLAPVLLGSMIAKQVGELQRDRLLGTPARFFEPLFVSGGIALVAAALLARLWPEVHLEVCVTLTWLVLTAAALAHQLARTVSGLRYRR